MTKYCISNYDKVHRLDKIGALDERCVPYVDNYEELKEHADIQHAVEYAKKTMGRKQAEACSWCEEYETKNPNIR
ncbi:MAG: hypothetical protein HAW59_01370 [Betaproteobacteria bacterium]|nr:hypothetical protein [Betaproteobacteria bacterium]